MPLHDLQSRGPAPRLQHSYTLMEFGPVYRESRKSTRVRLQLVIEARGLAQKQTCRGETHVVNLHGALISAPLTFHLGMEVEIYVILTDKRARATVVYIDPEEPHKYGIALKEPHNIWGISLPPGDWQSSEQ